MSRYAYFLLLVLALVSALAGRTLSRTLAADQTFQVPASQRTTAARLSLAAPSLALRVGEDYPVSLTFDPAGLPASQVSLLLAYPPHSLSLQSVQVDSSLCTSSSEQSIDPVAGTLRLSCQLTLPRQAQLFTLAKLTVRPVVAGSATLHFEPTALALSDGPTNSGQGPLRTQDLTVTLIP